MEKRIERKINTYMLNYKENIKKKAIELGLINPNNSSSENDNNINKLIQYIYDQENLKITKDDFLKRRRCKNVINIFERCCAKRATGDTCSRRKKQGSNFCGTHIKNQPNGIHEEKNNEEISFNTEKIEVFAQEIKGIIYYLDKNGNVYQIEDIMKNETNPKIIAKYIVTDGNYSIPDFDI